MKQTIRSCYQFADAFDAAGRAGQFSRQALYALFDFLEEREQDTGEEMELDVVGLCCDFTEYDSAREAAEAYRWAAPEREEDEREDDYAERCETEAREWLDGQTFAIDVPGGSVVIQEF